MPESFVQVPADGAGKRLRHRERTIDGRQVFTPYVLPVPERVVSARVTASSPRTLGNATTSQVLFTLENGLTSGVLLAVRRLAGYMDSTAALAAVVPVMRSYRLTAVPLGGTTITKSLLDTGQTSVAGVVARGATASDGGAATAITASLGVDIWDAMTQRLHTAVGQVLTDPIPILPSLCESEPFILRPGEALAAVVTAAATTSNPATNHYIVNAMFEEFVLP